jgi:DNA-binding transcriptional LysR family regulator
LRKRNDDRVPKSADNIATFVEVVRQHSLSGAARTLGLPKSTVSRRLLRLEQELHNKLLYRDARKITLTPAGRGFYASVVTAVDALDAAVAALEQSSQAPRGAIRVTAPPDLGRMVLAPMFVAFLERYPEISLDVLFTNRFVELVDEGVDLAVRAGRMGKSDLIARKLCDSELQLAAGPKTATRLAASTDVRSLEQETFVLNRAPSRSQVLKLERGAAKRARAIELKVTGRISVDDYAAMAELVAAGEGIGHMPAIHVREGVQAGRLVRLFPEWSSRSAHIYLVYAARQQPERVRLFTEFLLGAFANVSSV